MGRKRTTDRHLPERVYFKHGAYYYHAKDAEAEKIGKKWTRLGTTISEMYGSLSKLHQDSELLKIKPTTMRELFDRYARDVITTKKPATQRSNLNSLKFLRAFFDEMNIAEVESYHCFEYRDIRSKKAVIGANRDIELLSHAFSKAIEWGCLRNEAHPIRGLIIKNTANIRDRYVEDEEITAFKQCISQFLQVYIDLKILTGLSKSDLLSIKLSDIKEDGIHYQRIKTTGRGAKRKVIMWTTELVDAVNAAKELRRRIGTDYLFCTKDGDAYIKDDGTTSGFDSIWQRAMTKALRLGIIVERFTEHDLRAKTGSEIETLEEAQTLLDHTNAAMTSRVYRRKTVQVMPLQKPKKH